MDVLVNAVSAGSAGVAGQSYRRPQGDTDELTGTVWGHISQAYWSVRISRDDNTFCTCQMQIPQHMASRNCAKQQILRVV